MLYFNATFFFALNVFFHCQSQRWRESNATPLPFTATIHSILRRPLACSKRFATTSPSVSKERTNPCAEVHGFDNIQQANFSFPPLLLVLVSATHPVFCFFFGWISGCPLSSSNYTYCLNAGTCHSDPDLGAVCDCTSGFRGRRCQTPVPPLVPSHLLAPIIVIIVFVVFVVGIICGCRWKKKSAQ